MGVNNRYKGTCSSNAALVNKYVGTAYDHVKTVSDNIEDVKVVADALGDDFPDEGLDILVENIDDIVTNAENISDINTVAGIKDEVITVAGIEQEIIDVPSYTAQAIDAANAAEEDADRAETEADRATEQADLAANIADPYKGLWPDVGGGADKGDVFQTQVGGVGTGHYFTALQNTTVYPVGDNVNWREVVSVDSFSQYTDIAYKASGGNSAVENMIDDLNLNPLMYAVGTYIKTGGTAFEYTDSTGPITVDNFRAFGAYHVDDFKSPTDIDDTNAIQSVLDLGGSIEFAPLMVYEVSGTLTVKKDRTQVDFNGAEINNSTNEKLIFQFGDPNAVNGYARNCCIENFKITGNAASLGGIVLWSSAAVDDATGVSWNDSSKKNVIKNFEVNEIQSGASLTVYSWANSFYDFTVYREPGMLASKNGLILAYECNSNTFCNTYITGTDEQGIKTETGALTGAVVANNFTGSTTVQYCGGPTFSNIDIDRTWNTTFDVVYGEIHADSTAPFIKVGGASIDVKFKSVYLLVNTASDVPVLFETEGRNTEFGGVYLNANSAKTVVDIFKQGSSSTASVRLGDLAINGNITYTNVINSSRPYVWMDEDKIDIFSNDATGGNRLNLVSPMPTIRIEDSANNDSKKEFMDGGRWRVITRDESAGVDSDFINYDYTRPVSFTNGFGSPEGLVTANPGSWHSSTSGSMYVKVTGTSNTGWKRVVTE